jgi:hypothetical protein
MSPEAASSDPALGRRALITGAAVLGAAGVAAVVNASDAKAANGDTVRLGQGNSASGPTWITVRGGDRAGRDFAAFSVGDDRSSGLPTRAAIAARAAACIGVYADGSSYGVWGRSSGNVGVVGSSDAAAGVHGGGTSRGVTGAAASAAGIGVEGIAESTGGTGVKGTGDGVGVDGRGGIGVAGTSAAGRGVKGISTSGTGVEGTTTSGAQAVLGTHPATTGNGTGVKGTSASATGVGVTGVASHASGVTQGVRGDGTASPLGTGVVGLGRANGVYGESRKAGGKGVYGVATQAEGAASHGVYGQTASSAGAGVYGKGPSYDPDLEWNVTSYGVYAEGAIASTGPAFLGVPEYGTTARGDSRLQEGSMTFSADFSTPTPRLYVLVKSSDGRLFKAELPLTAM